MANFQISFREIAEIYLDCDRDIDIIVDIIATNNSHISIIDLDNFRQFLIRQFVPKFKIKWISATRIQSRFFENFKVWLSNVYCFGEDLSDNEESNCSPATKRGRPSQNYELCQSRAKRNKVQHLCQNTSAELISSASKRINKEEKVSTMFSPEKALSLILDASLSKHQYDILRYSAKEIGCDIFPPYYKVFSVKKQCYPENLEIRENCAKVSMQNLLDHTVSRILKTKTETEIAALPSQLELISKWGCDGSSGHSEYHQKFHNTNTSDKNMFLTSIVPLKLINNDDSLEYWRNTRPSSTTFCRPIKFEFVKETANVISEEVKRVQNEINNLKKSVINMFDKSFQIIHKPILTMIDGKVANTITETSGMAVCFICKAKPSEMNNLEVLMTKTVEEEALQYGISPLHARIKFMECILHIAYNKSFATWRVNKDTKFEREEAKKEIQRNLKMVLGINVDVVKQGMGTTNDGNTSRRFFANPSITADVLGVDENLIHRFGTILTALNSNIEIDAEKFHIYCMETAKRYVELYSWYYMPISVHKVLMHGSKIISAAILPIGMLSEEAQEARNKDYRQYRLNHSRKCDRISTNEDVMHLLLASSDPYINSFRKKFKKTILELPDDVKKLLKQ